MLGWHEICHLSKMESPMKSMEYQTAMIVAFAILIEVASKL